MPGRLSRLDFDLQTQTLSLVNRTFQATVLADIASCTLRLGKQRQQCNCPDVPSAPLLGCLQALTGADSHAQCVGHHLYVYNKRTNE